MLKLERHPRIRLSGLVFTVITLIFAGIGTSVISMQQGINQEKYQERLSKALDFCSSLFDEKDKKTAEATSDDLKDCKKQLETFKDEESAKPLLEKVENYYAYEVWENTANSFFEENGIVKESISEDDLKNLEESSKNLAKAYQADSNEKLSTLRNDYNNMREAENAANWLFTAADRKTVKPGINRKNYEDAKNKIDSLKQENLKNSLNESIKPALEEIEKQERIAREKAEAARKAAAERKKKIAESWHTLNISPYYINQYSAQIYNGCEAASLLMALKYKGHNRGTSFKSVVDDMPKSDDPNTGFYLSIYELEPKTEAHWIAPAPLAAYGHKISGANVVNASGWSLDRLDEEVKNGNPVIIYLTWAFKNPKTYSKGVPKNLHVMVLSGYNSFTGEQQFHDPWPAGSSIQTLSKARTEELYRASGYRAVVVK